MINYPFAMTVAEALDTSTAMGRLMMAVIGAVGEAERETSASVRASPRRSVKAATKVVRRPLGVRPLILPD